MSRPRRIWYPGATYHVMSRGNRRAVIFKDRFDYSSFIGYVAKTCEIYSFRICYPAEHQELYEKISKSGCIISEYPPGTKPRQYMFPQRNRLIAALSDELYVVDAGVKSGTETTIAACIAYGGGRKVYQI